MRVGVIGGGVSGLSCAYYLERFSKNNQAIEITLLEASSRLGGVLESERKNGFLIENGADSFLSEKPWAYELARELGLQPEIIGTNPDSRGLWVARGKELLEVPKGFYMIAPTQFGNFLMSSIFSLPEKIRILAEPFVKAAPAAGDESMASFIRRRFGQACLDKIGQAMLAGVYTGNPEKLSLSATMPKFIEYEKKYGSVIRALRVESKNKKSIGDAQGPRYSLFLSFKNGMQTLPGALAAHLKKTVIRMHTSIQSVHYEAASKKWRVRMAGGFEENFDVLVIALGAATAARFLKEEPKLSTLLSGIPMESVLTLNLAYDREAIGHSMKGYGFIVPRQEKRSLIACTFVNQKFKGRAPEGKVLLRAFAGGAFSPDILEKTDVDIVAAIHEDLKELLKIKTSGEFLSIHRYDHSMPQYQVGHLKLIEKIEEALEDFSSLHLIGSSYRGVGLSDCIREAQIKAEQIANRN